MRASRVFNGLWLLALLTHLPAAASPGAHGPGGEHLDSPASAHENRTSPHSETHSEIFELVARLAGGELSVMIDRYDSNEPVFGATLELESKGLHATGQFHADLGDYAFTDPALLTALSQPGEHALVFTVRTGNETDLLDTVLHVDAGKAPEEHTSVLYRIPAPGWILVAAIALAAVLFIALRGEGGKAVRA